MRQAHIGRSLGAEDGRTGGGRRPLRGRGALAAVGEGKAVLALGGAEMRRRGNRQPRGGSSLDEHAAECKSLRHGRARAVLPEIGDVGVHGREKRADALVEQVARKDQIEVAPVQTALAERKVYRGFLKLAFGEFPRFLP